MDRESIGKYLSIVRRAYSSLLDKKLKPYGISHGQIMLLMSLYKEEGVYQQKLCDKYNLNKAAVGREIKKLENNDFITRQADSQDKRKKLLYLTDRAKNFKPKLLKILDNVEKKVRKDIDTEELDIFFKVIKKICINLDVDIDKMQENKDINGKVKNE